MAENIKNDNKKVSPKNQSGSSTKNSTKSSTKKAIATKQNNKTKSSESAKKNMPSKNQKAMQKNLSPRNEMKLLDAKGKLYKNDIKTSSKNSETLKENLKQSNFKKQQKRFLVQQQGGNLNVNYNPYYDFNKAEGIIKSKTNCKPAKNNSANDINANIIGKKSNVKIFGEKFFVVSSIVFLVLFLLSFASNFLFFSYFKFKSEQPLITVTKPIELEIKESALSLASVTVPRHILPSSTISQKINAFSLTLNDNIVLRMQGVFTTGDGDIFSLNLTMTDDWLKGEDGYYYYKNFVQTGEIIEGATSFDVPEEFYLSINGKTMHVSTFAFETLPYNYSVVVNNWTSASLEWLQIVFN